MNEKEELFEISADCVTLEVTDSASGKTFRRTLPLDYYENAHCLRLCGEDLNGETAQIVFFSKRGVDKLRDMTGDGPDKDPCGGHSA